MIQEFEDETGIIIKEDVTSPAIGNMFTVRENAKQLREKFSKIFHSTTAKLLYIMKRTRPDIETSVSFLMRRVSKSDEDDWAKLIRTLGFIKSSINDKRKIGAHSLISIFTWVDASYAVHDNMRIHMGGNNFHGKWNYTRKISNE